MNSSNYVEITGNVILFTWYVILFIYYFYDNKLRLCKKIKLIKYGFSLTVFSFVFFIIYCYSKIQNIKSIFLLVCFITMFISFAISDVIQKKYKI